jgi:hypothetical protein
MLCVVLMGSGCATLRELPRSEFGARAERKRVRVRTLEGLAYEFDYAQIANDTLTGFTERDASGPVNEINTFRLPLDNVSTMAVREIDWYRTGLVGGGALAAIVAAGLTARNRHDTGGGESGGTKPPPPQ